VSAIFDPRAVARRFWARVGEDEPFPRRLTQSIAAALPAAVVFIPKLTIAGTANWLSKKRIGCIASTPDRPLRGCLIAQRGHAFIFVDGTLAEDEQRLTLAHETAHFVHHYEAPRTAALQLLGSGVEPILNGDRVPTPQEKLRGALRGAPLGVYEHMLDRHDGVPDPLTSRCEAEADLIAFELLAPANLILRTTKPGTFCRDTLVGCYGMPAWAAARWAAWIDARRVPDGLMRRLDLARAKKEH